MAKIGTAEIRKFLSSHLDRAVVLLFLFLLLGTIYVTVQKLNQDYKVLCKIEPANRPKDVSTAKPEDVTKAILSKPEESDYEELSKKNIFQNAEERLARQRQIKAKYDQCSTLIDAGHYADSIRMLEQIVRHALAHLNCQVINFLADLLAVGFNYNKGAVFKKRVTF